MKTRKIYLIVLASFLLTLLPGLLFAASTKGSTLAGAGAKGDISSLQSSGSASRIEAITPGPVPDELVVNANGLDWVWASPCNGGCSTPDPNNQVGWRTATDEELQNAPACSAFQRPDTTVRCASQYFDPNYTHCDYSDCLAGYVSSANGQQCLNGQFSGICESWYVRGELVIEAGTGRFYVTKTFTDGRDDEVDVTLTCNGGLPLVQDFTIAGGDDGVTFVVTDIPDTGVTCTVTESGSPDGYTPVMNGGDGCSWTNVTGGLNTCAIVNEADPGMFTVNKDWVIPTVGGEDFDDNVAVTIWCDAEISPYTDEDDGDWYYMTYLGHGDSATVSVDTTTGDASCRAVEDLGDITGVEASDDCGSQSVSAGEEVSCTFTNTLFFEGIPTLSHYGLAILVLLTLGVGMVGFRRFA